MKQIVVPTDFSNCALNALRVAADIARKNGSTIQLVHVYERPLSGISLQIKLDHAQHREIIEVIHRQIARLSKFDFLIGIMVKTMLLPDIHVWEIIEHEKLRHADLIVMGSHGCSGWKEFVIGSNTEKVVRHADCPVLVIKDRMEDFKVKNMVFASDFRPETATVFEQVKQFAQLFNARIHMLRVNTPGNFQKTHSSRKLMHEFAREFYLENYTVNIYNDKNVEQGILRFIKKIDADLIALTTHGHTGIAQLVNPSITESIVNHVHTPLISVKIIKPNIEQDTAFSNKDEPWKYYPPGMAGI